MNVAMRLLMRKSALAPVAPLRVKIGSGTTVTFDEPTALDSTHLLVAVSTANGNNTPYLTEPQAAGWSLVSGSGNNGSANVRMWVRQGNSSVNSFVLSATPTAYTLTLYAFTGFTSTTPLGSAGASLGTGSSASVTPSSGLGSRGVAFAAIRCVSSMTAISAWSGSYTAAFVSLPVYGSYKAYPPSDTVYTTGISWGGANSIRTMWAVMPLV